MNPYRHERGAATLVVVMVMFLIMAMLAAYANRNLVFEQRIASNYVRSAAAHEAAEAGLEWGLALLNGSKIDGACQPSASGTDTFRNRYMSIDGTTGAIALLAPASKTMIANCARATSGTWQCQCPGATEAVPGPQLAGAQEAQPSFNLQLEFIARNGVVRLKALGCSDSQLDTCTDRNLNQQAAANALLLGNSQMRVEAALLSALKMPPAAPLISRLALSTDVQGAGLHNSDPRSGGVLLISGENLPPDLPEDRLDSLPGSSARQALFGPDSVLKAASEGDAMFRLFFGMPSASYRMQPAMKRITCNGDCAQTLLDAYDAGTRMLWVDGDLSISSNIALGSDAEPLVLVAAGAVTLDGPMRLHGLLYARGDLTWHNGSGLPALLKGAAIAEGRVKLAGRVDFWYLSSIMDRLNKATGSFVRVPGSWSDMNK